jgi:hypothetical protein
VFLCSLCVLAISCGALLWIPLNSVIADNGRNSPLYRAVIRLRTKYRPCLCFIQQITIPTTSRGRLKVCEMLRIPHCPDNRLTDGCKVVSPAHRPHGTTPEMLFFPKVNEAGSFSYIQKVHCPHRVSNSPSSGLQRPVLTTTLH